VDSIQGLEVLCVCPSKLNIYYVHSAQLTWKTETINTYLLLAKRKHFVNQINQQKGNKSIGNGAAFGNTQLSQTNTITSLDADRIADFPSHVSNDVGNTDTNTY
jgi:hypothetical protein